MRAAGVLFIVVILAAPASGQEDRRALEERLHELEERLRRLEGAAPVASPAPPSVELPAQADGAAVTPPAPTGPAEKLAPEARIAALEEKVKTIVGSTLDNVRLAGSLDAAFTWNFNDPRNRIVDVNRLRVNDPDHDSFEINWAKISFGRVRTAENDWDAGFFLEPAFGREVQNTLSLDPRFLSDLPVNLAQAFVDLQAPLPHGSPVLLRFGRQYSWFGVESLDTPANPNYSLSYLFRNSPFTTTGVGIGTELGLGFRYGQYVVNGWDLVVDNNQGKSVGGQLYWGTKDPEASIAFNWIYGPELPRNNHDKRWLAEVAALLRPFDGTLLLAAAQLGQEEGADVRTGRLAKFGGATLIVRQDLYEVREGFRRFYVAARATYYRDQGGSRTGVDQALYEVTGTFAIQFTTFARLRFEYRRDATTADGGFFFGRNRLPNRDAQDTVSVDAAFQF